MAKVRAFPSDLTGSSETPPSRFAARPRSLADAIKTGVRRLVSIRKLTPHPLQSPERHAFENVLDLVENLRRIGLQVPPVVWQRPDGTYIILAGHRRVAAWMILYAEGVLDIRMPVTVVRDITEAQAVYIMASETYLVSEWSAVQDAMVVGSVWEALGQDLGRPPSVREVARFVPDRSTGGTGTTRSPGKSSIHEALKIYEALRDPRWSDAVRRADSAGKKLLKEIVSVEDEHTKRRALELAAEGETAEARRVLRAEKGAAANSGLETESGADPLPVVEREEVDGGFELTLRIAEDRSTEELREALKELRRAIQDLEALVA